MIRVFSFLMLAAFATSCGGGDTIHPTQVIEKTQVVETNTVVEKAKPAALLLTATKVHKSNGSVFIPDDLSFSGSIIVPDSLVMIQGLGSNDARAAVLEIDNGAVECLFSPSSTVNKPYQSKNSSQIQNSVRYWLLSCSDSSLAGDEIAVTSNVKLSLNKADSGFAVTTIQGRIEVASE